MRGRRLLTAALAALVLTLAGCRTLTGPGQHLTTPPAPAPAPAPGLAASRIVGVWRLTVNGTGGALAAFWPGGLVETTDPAMGVWRARTTGPGDIEGTWDVPLVDLSVTYVIAVDRDSFTGTGVAFDTRPGAKLNPITLAGTRVTIDPAVLARVTPPRTS